MNPSFSTLQTVVFFTFILLGLGLFAYTVSLFVMPFFWAVVIAIVLFPIYERIRHAVKSDRLGALLVILLLCIGIIAPVTLLATAVGDEAVAVYQNFSDVPSIQDALTPLSPYLSQVGISPDETQEYIQTYGKMILAILGEHAFTIGKATIVGFFKTLLMLYLLYFMLKDGKRLLRFAEYHIPIGNSKEQHLWMTFVSITRALFKGTLVVALAQTFVCALLFAIAGVPHILLLTAIALVLACIPGIGPTLVWGPVSAWLYITGNIFGAGIVLAGGLLIVSLIDNVLRPLLVGRDTALPDPLVLISILGGIATFGVAGLIIGPVTAGLALALLGMFREQYATDLELRG